MRLGQAAIDALVRALARAGAPTWEIYYEEGRELSVIGVLRYDLYVARDRKAYPSADHINRSLIEPVDPTTASSSVAPRTIDPALPVTATG